MERQHDEWMQTDTETKWLRPGQLAWLMATDVEAILAAANQCSVVRGWRVEASRNRRSPRVRAAKTGADKVQAIRTWVAEAGLTWAEVEAHAGLSPGAGGRLSRPRPDGPPSAELVDKAYEALRPPARAEVRAAMKAAGWAVKDAAAACGVSDRYASEATSLKYKGVDSPAHAALRRKIAWRLSAQVDAGRTAT